MSISSVGQISMSGLIHQTNRLNGSAGNVANVETEGYQAIRVDSVAQANGGVRSEVSQTGAPNPIASDSEGTLQTLSNTNLMVERVSQISAVNAFAASAAVIRTGDEMERALLDIKA